MKHETLFAVVVTVCAVVVGLCVIGAIIALCAYA